MRLYLDTNVYAHAQDLAAGPELCAWLVSSGHEVVLSEVHLAEAIAIPDAVAREARLRLLAALPSRRSRPLAYVQSAEFVEEVRRLRARWRREPAGDLSHVNALLASYDQGWEQLSRDPAQLIKLTGDYRIVAEQAIRGSRAGQKTLRGDLLDRVTTLTEFCLGAERIPVRRLDLTADDDFCRFESCVTWFQALVLAMPTLAELRDYAAPYIEAGAIGARDFVAFWVDEVDLDRLPRGLATSVVISEQRRAKIEHGNVADARHAGYILDADLFVTEDRGFYGALERVVCRLRAGGSPQFIERSADLITGLSAAVAAAGSGTSQSCVGDASQRQTRT